MSASGFRTVRRGGAGWSVFVVFGAVALGSLTSGCAADSDSSGNEPLLVYAAASLVTVLPEVGEAFQQQHPAAEVRHHFAASSLLAKQIARGAEADLYISADPRWVDYLEERGRVVPGSRVEPLSNRLVLILPARDPVTVVEFHDLANPGIRRIAVADWTHVPAGRYTASLLRRAGLWQQVQAKLIPALDVRAALAYVARGEVDCGIVYATDAHGNARVRVMRAIADSLQPRIRYVAARVDGSRHALAASYLEFLSGAAAAELFSGYGFTPLAEGAADE